MTASKSKKNKYEIDMCNGTVLDKLISFSIPLMLSSILQLLFNAVDIVVVGIYESFYRSFPRSERTGCPFLCDKTGKADV